MQGGTEEKQMGFHASEASRLKKAWAWTILYEKNSRREKMWSDVYMYLMMLLNLVVVCFIVYKTVKFPAGSSCSDKESETQEDCDAAEGTWKVDDDQATLKLLLVVLPLISGVLLTFNNAFNPIQKFNALRWASAATESEIYTYRCRAKNYSAVTVTQSWATDADVDGPGEEDDGSKVASKKFVAKISEISSQVRGETQLQISSMRFGKEKDEAAAVKKRTSNLFQGEVASSDEVDVLIHMHDKGFEQLSAEDYLQYRTRPKKLLMENQLPPLSRRKNFLQALTYVATAASVMLGTLEMDLYIAITTGVVSFLSGIIEYQKLEAR
eukprot:COSAG05_NODE_1082_length_5937_cov_2.133265_1_plen_324_part_10